MDDRADHGGAIAIIGLACRFPGAAEPAEFHDLIVAGRRMFRPLSGGPPPLHAAPLDDWSASPGSFDDHGAGAQDTGPVQKLAAETTALALADAGLRDLAGMLPEAAARLHGVSGPLPAAAGRRGRTGLVIASAAAGVCEQVREQFGFPADIRYPAAARASSLHAVVAAAQALQAGDLDLAVAGGAELGLDPAWLARQAQAGMLGSEQMRVYAADPAGLLPGEGCGVVVLARSADARAAGFPVYAEIAGWSTGPAWSGDGAALLPAYRQAGIDPAEIQLLEGAGTGTAAGDLAELTALARLRQGGRSVAALGAVSAGIGYSRAAAGIASLVKTALALATGTIPPGTGWHRPHPLIASGDALLRLPAGPEPWPDADLGAPGVRFAAVNALGTADPADLQLLADPRAIAGPRALAGPQALTGPREGEGVHLVLRREPEAGRARGRRRRAAEDTAPAEVVGPPALSAPVGVAAPAEVVGPPALSAPVGVAAPAEVVGPAALSAPVGVVAPAGVTATAGAGAAPGRLVKSPGGPRQLSVFGLCGEDPARVADRLEVIAAGAGGLGDAELRELARQLACGVLRAGDGAGPVRVALTAGTPGQLVARAQVASRLLRAGGAAAGHQAANQAAGDQGVHVSVGAAGRVVMVFGGLAGSGLTHSAMLAASFAGLRTLDQLGVTPGAAVGYSLGEIAGLAWAGSLPWAEAARLAAQCGQVLRGCACGPAAMARVSADADVALALAAPEGLYIAAYEGARAHVLAGSTMGVRNLTRRAATVGVAVEVLGITHAMHSPAMARCAAPLRSLYADARFAPPRRRLISTITGRAVLPGDDLAGLLAGQLSQPVLFAQAMSLAAEGADLVVTAGPDDGLAAMVAGCGVPWVAVPAQPSQASPATARAVAALFAAGAITDLTPFMSPPPPAARLAGVAGAGRPLPVPRMRDGEPSGAAPDAGHETGPRTTIRSGQLAG
jgi:enediyne polyketide synthase